MQAQIQRNWAMRGPIPGSLGDHGVLEFDPPCSQHRLCIDIETLSARYLLHGFQNSM